MGRKNLVISVPTEEIEDADCDLKTFYLRERLHELIKVYRLGTFCFYTDTCHFYTS